MNSLFHVDNNIAIDRKVDVMSVLDVYNPQATVTSETIQTNEQTNKQIDTQTHKHTDRER